MDINDIFTNGLNVNDARDLLWDVAVYVLGMTVYAVFVFNFYRFVASKDMFGLDLSRFEESRFPLARSTLHVAMYIVKYIIVFPVLAFFWFAVLTLILAFLSKGQTFPETLLIALATVSSIRVAAYYNEDLSRDLAKILPFAVLAVFLIDASFFSASESLDVLRDANDYSENILYYLVFLVALEFVLRVVAGVARFIARLGERGQAQEEAGAEGDAAPLKEAPPAENN